MSAKRKTAAQLLRESAERDPVAHGQRLARGYGVGPETTVQVPVALIEYLEDHVHAADVDNSTLAADILALIPQPTPSAYQCNGDAGCADGFSDGQGHSLRCQIDNRPQPTPSAEPVAAWRDRHGDEWTEGDDGLMHTRETAPFSREYVEKKWGPLVAVAAPLSIEEMASGTEFTQQIRWTVRRAADGAPYVENDTDALPGHYIDPSTIRDIVVPSAGPGE